jgi:glycosyltransferase involved in cell wall biosynthesis
MTQKQTRPLVIIVQRIIPHYRLPFFDLLSKSNPGFEIRVCHGDPKMAEGCELGFAAQWYKTSTYQFFGYSIVLQPKLAIDILRESPDVLILEGTFGNITNVVLLLARKIQGFPTLFWTAGWDNPKITGLRLLIKTLFIRLNLLLATGAIVYGSSAARYLENRGLPKEKIVVAQNTVDVENMISRRNEWLSRGQAIREQFGCRSKRIILYVGQISPIKRVDILLQVFQHLRSKFDDVALLIVGEGEQSPALRQYVHAHQIPDTFFAGEVVDGVEAYFAASDLFVLPGTGGLALNQAMASGLPVIATVADGTQEDLIVPGENGYIVPVDDVAALETAMMEILSSPEKLSKMRAGSLRIVQERALLQNMVARYSQAIRQFVSC